MKKRHKQKLALLLWWYFDLEKLCILTTLLSEEFFTAFHANNIPYPWENHRTASHNINNWIVNLKFKKLKDGHVPRGLVTDAWACWSLSCQPRLCLCCASPWKTSQLKTANYTPVHYCFPHSMSRTEAGQKGCVYFCLDAKLFEIVHMRIYRLLKTLHYSSV